MKENDYPDNYKNILSGIKKIVVETCGDSKFDYKLSPNKKRLTFDLPCNLHEAKCSKNSALARIIENQIKEITDRTAKVKGMCMKIIEFA